MGLKRNIFYSSFLTTSLYIFQFITYPYVARVLGVANIGICNYVQSIVQYFMLFSMLGIMTLGVREIAKCNGDKDKLHQVFSNLFTLNLSLTVLALIAFCATIECFPQFRPYKTLLYIGVLQLFFNTFAIEWLFRGLENFKYVTIRTLFVRLGYVISVFLFVRDSDDYVIYFVIYSCMIVANGIINWCYSRRFVKFSFQPFSVVQSYIKPLLFLGSQQILLSLYTTFNILYLGMTCGDTQVGYYTTATKIENIILALYSSFTLVMMPRISAIMETQNNNEVKRLIQQSFNLLFAFVFPCIFFTEFYAEELVFLIAGNGYEGAVMPMRIVMPLMLIIGLEQILIVQILMPNRSDKQVLINSIVGAACSIIFNSLLVSNWGSKGSALVWFISELSVMLTAYYFVSKRYKFNFMRNALRHLLAFIPILLVFFVISQMPILLWSKFIIGLIVTFLYTHVALYYMVKNEVYIIYANFLIAKVSRK